MKVIITGGAGFIGVNIAEYFAQKDNDVVLFDNLSRVGTEENIKWILNKFPKIEFIKGDIRSVDDCNKLFQNHNDALLIIHLAGQVAVTTSVINPRDDFEINALGTFNILESIRKYSPNSVIIYSSTNKVYGEMKGISISEQDGHYIYENISRGISEDMTLDFHSPYGCSKGSGDQYFHDYSRIYNLKTVVFRQSCIYGYHQFGIEDQGWVAWFTIASVINQPITIYGDGKQVRDVLFIDDLNNAYDKAYRHIKKTSGQVYNIGGGPDSTLFLLELLNYLEEFIGKKIEVSFSDWRPGDQKVYVSNIEKARKDFGWAPEVSVEQGLRKLFDWVYENQSMIKSKIKGLR